MSCNQIVNAALASCGCAPKGISSDRFLVDRVTGSRATLGQRVQVDLTSIPEKTPDGRIAHIRGFWIQAVASLTVSAGTNDAVLARTLRAIFQSINLRDASGHQYLAAIDGRDLLDDVYFRTGSRIDIAAQQAGDQVVAGATIPYSSDISTEYGLNANAGAATYSRGASLYIPFGSPLDPNPLRGLIPAAALRQDRGGEFSFNLRSDIPGSPANTTLAGVLNQLGSTGLDVWADVVYMDGLVIDSPWTFDSYLLQAATGRLRYETAEHEYAMLRFRAAGDSFGGTTDATFGYEAQAGDVNNMSVQVAGMPTPLTGLDYRYAFFRSNAAFVQNPLSAAARFNAKQDLPIVNSAVTRYLLQVLLPYRPSGMGAPAGQVDYQFGSIGSLTNLRFMHRVRLCQDGMRAEAIADATKCPVTGAVPVTPNGARATNFSPVVLSVR